MDCSSGYELDAQALPAARLTSYPCANSLCWWKEAAQDIFQTSDNFDFIESVIKFIPLPPQATIAALSGRRKPWLDKFLTTLCRDKAVQEPSCYSRKSTAEVIVKIIRQRPSPFVTWSGDWILERLTSSTDIPAVAERLDFEIHSTFCTITFSDWTEWCHGHENERAGNFLNAVFNFRNSLAKQARQHIAIFKGLQQLQKLSLSRSLPNWIISTALSNNDTLSDPSDGLQFVLDPIKIQFQKHSSILALVRELLILDTRYRLGFVQDIDPRWPTPISLDFTFWERVQGESPQSLAISHTEITRTAFSELLIADVLGDKRIVGILGRLWTDLSLNVFECLVANKKLTGYFMDVAKHFVSLENIHSATAIGSAFLSWGFQPDRFSELWNIINPEDDFAGAIRALEKNPGQPPLLLSIPALRLSQNSPDQLRKLFLFLEYCGASKGVKLAWNATIKERGETIIQSYSPNQRMHLPFSWFSTISRGSTSTAIRTDENLYTSRLPSVDGGAKQEGEIEILVTVVLEQSYQRLPLSHYLSTPPAHTLACSFTTKYSPTNPLHNPARIQNAAKWISIFRQQHAEELWAFTVWRNHHIFTKARQQLNFMLLGMADEAVRHVFCRLDWMELALLSSAPKFDKGDHLTSTNWTNNQKNEFCSNFTSTIPKKWACKDILSRWEELVKDIHLEVTRC